LRPATTSFSAAIITITFDYKRQYSKPNGINEYRYTESPATSTTATASESIAAISAASVATNEPKPIEYGGNY
jgi:hypothetical protein